MKALASLVIALGTLLYLPSVMAVRSEITVQQVDDEYDPAICGALTSSYGPFDYRTATASERRLVESFHYDKGMEAMRQGDVRRTAQTIWGEFTYTLNAFPNHHGALVALDRLSWDLKVDTPSNHMRTARCFFLRAVTFRPDDGAARLLFGLYLLRRGESSAALAQLSEAASLSPNDSNVQYNLGLAYLRLKDYDRAMTAARRAYDLGFPLPGLRNLLKKAGKWSDSPTPESVPASPATGR